MLAYRDKLKRGQQLMAETYLEHSHSLDLAVRTEGQIGLGDDLVEAADADVGAAHLPIRDDDGTPPSLLRRRGVLRGICCFFRLWGVDIRGYTPGSRHQRILFEGTGPVGEFVLKMMRLKSNVLLVHLCCFQKGCYYFSSTSHLQFSVEFSLI